MIKTKEGIIKIILFILIIAGLCATILIKKDDNTKNKLTDAERFAQEYTEIDKDNVFVYKTAEEIIDILEHGTGIVYLGFPECKWCQAYTKYLHEVAKEVGIEKIYYFNIRKDRDKDSDDYKKILDLIDEDIQYNDEGHGRIFVPDVTAVKDGKIVGRDYETSKDTKGFDEPKDYWTEEEVKDLKAKLKTMMEDVKNSFCTDGCND